MTTVKQKKICYHSYDYEILTPKLMSICTLPRAQSEVHLYMKVCTTKINNKVCIIAWKALGRDCTNNNGLILQIGVLSSLIINEGLYHTVFAGIRYLGVYI